MWLTWLGIFSGLLVIIADIPYILNAYKGKTKPHRITWFIVFILNVISLANQHASGATHSLWLIIGGTIASLAVFAIAVPKGTGGFAKLDIIVLIGVIFGLFLWWLLGAPLASIICGVIVSIIALIPTFKKSYYDPASETRITWLIGAIAGFLAAVSVGKLDYSLLIIPVYSCVVQVCLYTIIRIRTPMIHSKT